MDLSMAYTKIRADFGRQPMFCEYGPTFCDSIPVDIKLHKQFILRNPVHREVQHGPRFSREYINTIRVDYTTTGMNHAEGGWPKDVNINDPETTQRYRRKVEKEDNYINCVMNCAPAIEKLILQNNAIDMYQSFFNELPPQGELMHMSCRTINVFRDPSTTVTDTKKRVVSSICWRPDYANKFIASYNLVDFDKRPIAPIECHIWDTENATSAERSFTPPAALLDLQYNARDNSVLAGGLINGQVLVYDCRTSMNQPTNICPPHIAHRDHVIGVRFINAKSGREFFSGSVDGSVKWWDTRNMNDELASMMIHVVPNTNTKQTMALTDGISCLEFEPTIPTRFMVGTENGLVIGGNRKGKSVTDILPLKLETHLGPVWAVERNPGFLKNFLTVGDWTARIWTEECKESAILWTPPQKSKILHGAWSPTRASLFLIAHQNGVLALWDILTSHVEPVLTLPLCEDPLVKLAPQEAGTLVACGNKVGNIFMVELSPSLAVSEKHDRVLVTALFERETKRERILEARLREIRVKQRAAEEGGGLAVASVVSLPEAIGDKDLQEATTEFFSITKKELQLL